MNLSDWRRRIDELDKKLVELLNERSRCALEIGKIKQAERLPLYQPDREREVLQNAERHNAGPLTDAAFAASSSASSTKLAPPNATPCTPMPAERKRKGINPSPSQLYQLARLSGCESFGPQDQLLEIQKEKELRQSWSS